MSVTKITAKCSFNRHGVRICYPPQNGPSGGGITAVAPVGYLLRVKTVGTGDVVLTAEAAAVTDDGTSISIGRDVAGSAASIYAQNGSLLSYGAFTDVNFTLSVSNPSFQSSSIVGSSNASSLLSLDSKKVTIYGQTTGEGGKLTLEYDKATLETTTPAHPAFIKLDTGEAYLQSISVPNGAATAIGVNSSGKIVPVTSGGGTVTSVSGTANRISSTGGATPVIDIDAAYVGQTSITTIGTITTGTVPASHVSAGTFGTGAYVMDTSLTNPILIGGTGTTSTLTFRPTSGNSTTGADFIWQTGNNGATERMRMLNAGNLIIGGTTLVNTNELLSVQGSTNGNVNYAIRNATAGTAARASAAIMSGGLGLYINALSTSYTTSGINVTGKATILTDMLGLNIGTTSAQSLQFWTNNTQKAFIPSTGGLIVGTAALATNATGGFLYIPTCAGTPTGVPTAQTGTVPMVWDSTNKKFYIYDGSWLGGTAPGVFS